MHKYEIARLLAKRYGYTTYLEICTPTTGGTFSYVDKQQFSRRVRVMYRRPSDFSDGEPIDSFTEDESGEELFAKLARTGEKFDLVFIDSFHTYAASLRDIIYGLSFVKSNGVVLIHDCLPPNAAYAVPEFIPGAWCGLTFAAYLDVVLYTEGLNYVTLDSDFGCGIISKDDRLAHLSELHPSADLIHEWKMLDLSQKYPFFEEHHVQLLRLISPDDFHERLLGGLIQATANDTGSIKMNQQQETDVDALQNDLLKATIALDITQSLLGETKNALKDSEVKLKNIKNTSIWKTYEFITNISLVRKFYFKVFTPVKKWLTH